MYELCAHVYIHAYKSANIGTFFLTLGQKFFSAIEICIL